MGRIFDPPNSGPDLDEIREQEKEDERKAKQELTEQAVRRNRRSTRERLKNPALVIPGFN